MYCWHCSKLQNKNDIVQRNFVLPPGRETLPDFKEALSERGDQLPKFVEREVELDKFLRCGRLKHRFCEGRMG